MHLGVLKDHSLSYLGLVFAAKKLELDTLKANQLKSTTNGEVFESLSQQKMDNSVRKKRPAGESDNENSGKRLRPLMKKNLGNLSKMQSTPTNPNPTSVGHQ